MTLLDQSQQKQEAYFQSIGISPEEGMANLYDILDIKILIKIGGECLINGGYNLIGQKLADLHALGVIPTILHGGSRQISDAMRRRGLEPKFVNGLRTVQDQATLDAVVEGLEGVNNELVSAINKHAEYNIAYGLMDAKICYARKHPHVLDEKTEKLVDLGFVGEVTKVNTRKIDTYLENGIIPVLWCIGYGKNWQRYNVNADHVGEKLAVGYDKYITLTSIGGYMNEDGEVVSEMAVEEAKQHYATEGMAIKIDSLVKALEGSEKLQTVQITSPESLLLELFLNQGSGTIIRK